MSKTAKGLLGIVIWIILGFMIYVACAGLGIVAYFIWNYIPWYHVILGSLAGCIVVFFMLLERVNDER